MLSAAPPSSSSTLSPLEIISFKLGIPEKSSSNLILVRDEVFCCSSSCCCCFATNSSSTFPSSSRIGWIRLEAAFPLPPPPPAVPVGIHSIIRSLFLLRSDSPAGCPVRRVKNSYKSSYPTLFDGDDSSSLFSSSPIPDEDDEDNPKSSCCASLSLLSDPKSDDDDDDDNDKGV